MLKSVMFRAISYGVATCFLAGGFILAAAAQTPVRIMPHDFMVNNTPLTADDLRTAFKGRTHEGFYRFERNDVSTTRFTETTAADGTVKHVQGSEIIDGTWTILSNRMCYKYSDAAQNVYCFDIYRVGTCYYHFIRTSNGIPVNRWTARTTPKGEVPDCELPFT